MTGTTFGRTAWYILASASMLALAPAAYAQSAEEKEAEPPADAPSPDDPSLLTVGQEESERSSADSRTAVLEAQIAGLQAQLDALKSQVTKATPTWKGAPQWTDKEGWSFKVRGRLMLDVAHTGEPNNWVANENLGFNGRVRRARIGVEGAIPGGFGYKAEVDYANGSVGFGDVVLSYAPSNAPVSFAIGNQETLNGMEQQSSSRWSSFIERAQINDAFGNTRRLGLVVGTRSKDDMFRFDAGMFTAHSIDGSMDNDGWIAAARMVATPHVGNGFAHFGLNYQHREFQSNNNGVASTSTGAPSTNQLGRYRARPFLQTTDQRFVDTGSLAARGDDIFGVEAYGVFKSLHIGGEAQMVKVRTYRPGDLATGIRAFSTANTAVTPVENPTFWGGHVEVGYFLTGETRGYKNGLWDRTKVLNPVNKGGMGAIQIIGRFDYLDLDDQKLIDAPTNNFTTGVASLSSAGSRQARGGKQIGYLAGVTWIPTDYVRFLLNYIHTSVEGGPYAAIARPASVAPINERNYSTDSIALRAQIDF